MLGMLVEFVRDVIVVVAVLMSAIAIALHVGIGSDFGGNAPTRDTRVVISPATTSGAGMPAQASPAPDIHPQ